MLLPWTAAASFSPSPPPPLAGPEFGWVLLHSSWIADAATSVQATTPGIFTRGKFVSGSSEAVTWQQALFECERSGLAVKRVITFASRVTSAWPMPSDGYTQQVYAADTADATRTADLRTQHGSLAEAASSSGPVAVMLIGCTARATTSRLAGRSTTRRSATGAASGCATATWLPPKRSSHQTSRRHRRRRRHLCRSPHRLCHQ